MSKPKLTYFRLSGLAEPTRFLLAYAGIEYDDVRITHDEWKDLKSTFPFGQLPCLEIDGCRLNQHKTIARYAARKAKLAGNNALEAAVIDSVVDSINDFRLKLVEVFVEPNEDIKKLKREKIDSEIIPSYVEKLEALLSQNKGYFALGRLTWADLYFASLEEIFVYIKPDFFDAAPKLNEILQRVKSIPNIKKWIETRPVNQL